MKISKDFRAMLIAAAVAGGALPCRSCGTAVYWLTNVRTGKRAPIEATPHNGGTIRVYLDDGTYDIPGPVDRRAHPEEPYYLNHFARCPQARRWKQPEQLERQVTS